MEPNEVAAAWRLAFARQSISDFRVYDILSARMDVDTCQRLHYLQMALEKAAKAHFWGTGGLNAVGSAVNSSHEVTEKFLPLMLREHWARTRPGRRVPAGLMIAARRLCREVDLLAPAVKADGQRLDNCEYPWQVEDPAGNVLAVVSPLDHEFSPTHMVRDPFIAPFLKAIRGLVSDIVRET